MPDHSTLRRRAETLEVPKACPSSKGPVHLLGDSTGFRLCGPGEWLTEKHSTRRRRSWRKLHIGVGTKTGRILASELMRHGVDDGSRVGSSLDQVTGALGSVIADGAYDQADISSTVAKRYPAFDVIIPPRSVAVPTEKIENALTRRDRHLQCIAEPGRMGWQKVSGYNRRALVEAAIGHFKRVLGDAVSSPTDRFHTTEIAITVRALNRMRDLGRPKLVGTA